MAEEHFINLVSQTGSGDTSLAIETGLVGAEGALSR
jgi:hypothetical protein